MSSVSIRFLVLMIALSGCTTPASRVTDAGFSPVPRAPARSPEAHGLVGTFRSFVDCQKRIPAAKGNEWAICMSPYVVPERARVEFFARFLLSVDRIRDEHPCSARERGFAGGYPEQTDHAICFVYGERGERGIAFFVLQNEVPRLYSIFGL